MNVEDRLDQYERNFKRFVATLITLAILFGVYKFAYRRGYVKAVDDCIEMLNAKPASTSV